MIVRQDASAKDSLLWVLLFLFVLWTIHTITWQTGFSFTQWGLFPRKTSGLIGILTMPLIHKDLDHLWHNSFGLLVTGWILFFAYPKAARPTVLTSWFLIGLGVWLFARPAFHIGASGLVYAFSSFIFFSGIIHRDRTAIGYTLIVAFFFGASFWGIFPFQKGVSWEGHLAGAIMGLACAWLWRKRDRHPPPPDKEPRFREPAHWPVSEIPYLEGTQLAPQNQDPTPDSSPSSSENYAILQIPTHRIE